MGLIITLILVGILLIIAEIILIPGIFITGFIGLASLVASCYVGWTEFGQTGGIITILLNIILLSLFVVLALRAKTWRKLSLTRLAPMGKVLLGTQSVEATSMEGIIDPQKSVIVTQIIENKIYVKLK